LQIHYRPEIDGLRAVAVVPVILFHAGIDAFGGGFVGVDVFFVISGYLITSIILAEQADGTFSLLSFYERRARRILPALFLVIAASSLMAWLLFFPSDLEAFSRSVIATALFSSNFLFWHETGYFDTAAELKPLLHTWSLAVEEQYYILFPLFLMAMWRAAQSRTALALALLGVASLVLAEWGAHEHPEAAFFLLPFRLWELALGALAALYLSGRQPSFGLGLSQLGSGVGLVLIIWAVFGFDKNTPFPGFNALVPTVGAALIILFTTPSTLVGRLLSTRQLVRVGLISYSAYLWHQPLLAFARYKSLTEPPVWVVLGICTLTFGLAYLSWRFVEIPLRRKGAYSRRDIFVTSAIGTAIAVVLGMAGVFSKGFEDRFVASLDDRQKAVWYSTAAAIAEGKECQFRMGRITKGSLEKFAACAEKHGQAIVVLGDSHGGDVYNALSQIAWHPFLIGVVQGGCRPHTPEPECHYDEVESFLSRHAKSVSKVIYNQAGFYLITDETGAPGRRRLFRGRRVGLYPPNHEYVDKVAAYLQRLETYADVIWVGPWLEPHVNVNVLRRLALNCWMVDVSIDRNIAATFERLDDVIAEKLKQYPAITYISSIKALTFSSAADLYDCQHLYWSDGDHWSGAGEQRFGRRLAKALDETRLTGAP
jgi:peptidoglycan/LPS O-acetylase OafA/YrhL/lysophospholipase L1-like esterase